MVSIAPFLRLGHRWSLGNIISCTHTYANVQCIKGAPMFPFVATLKALFQVLPDVAAERASNEEVGLVVQVDD